MGLVGPVVAEIGRRAPSLAAACGVGEVRVSVFVSPCVSASAADKAYVRSVVPDVEKTIGPGEYLRYLVTNRLPKGLIPSDKGVVLFLGGDVLPAALLARRLGYPALAYTQEAAGGAVGGVAGGRGKSVFQRFLVPYDSVREKLAGKGIPPEKVAVIGNLMLEAVAPSLSRAQVWERWRLGETGRQAGDGAGNDGSDRDGDGDGGSGDTGGPLILLLPGSRPAEVRYLTGFFLEAAELLSRDLPGARFVWGVSPFISEETMRRALLYRRRGWEWAGGEMVAESDAERQRYWTVRAANGLVVRAVRGRQHDLMAACDMALTVPGTYTAELAYLGVPMVVAMPLNSPEELPLEGLIGLVGLLPGAGPALKKRLILHLLRRRPLATHPNLIAGTQIVPELRGILRPVDLAFAALELWNDPRRRGRISEKERQVMGEKGAAARLVEEIEALMC